jgi:hypothetical protein
MGSGLRRDDANKEFSETYIPGAGLAEGALFGDGAPL